MAQLWGREESSRRFIEAEEIASWTTVAAYRDAGLPMRRSHRVASSSSPHPKQDSSVLSEQRREEDLVDQSSSSPDVKRRPSARSDATSPSGLGQHLRRVEAEESAHRKKIVREYRDELLSIVNSAARD
jgi:hypothetical protein